MKTKTPVWLLLLFTLVLPACAADNPEIVALGDNTYTVTVSANDKFTRNTEKLKARAIDAATEYCARMGKQFKLVSSTGKKSFYLVGDFAKTTITFKALDAGAPELAAAPAAMASPAPAAVAPAPAPKPMTTDELQSELTKLDDIRKKGLLTDAEFDALKQKIISRF